MEKLLENYSIAWLFLSRIYLKMFKFNRKKTNNSLLKMRRNSYVNKDGRKAHEKMLHIFSHEGNAN